QSGFCLHKSWGFGKITTVDTVFARFTIDFNSKKNHAMDLEFAAESLQPIPSDHILARKIADLEALREMAALHHLDLIKLVLQSFGGRATLEQIRQILVPDIIQDDWKKWWEVAKRELRKDGHFQVPTKKSEPLIYQVKEIPLQERLMAEFRAAKGLKARLALAHEMFKNLSDLSDKKTAVTEIVATLNTEIASYQRNQPAVALEAIFVRDELREAVGLPPAENEISSQAFWSHETKVGPLLEQIPAPKHRRALQSFKAANPMLWHEALLGSLNYVSAKLATEFAHALIEGGKLEQLKETVSKLISRHTASSDLLLWLAKERSDSFADILGPEVFRAMLTALERDQFKEKRSNKLRDYISANPSLLVELISSADAEIIKDLTRALQLSPCFDDVDKRSLLGHIVKSYPAIQPMISGEAAKTESTYIVSWESLERRRNEYADLVQKTIPANSKEIAIARSYGDLRENHEYKAAKETQKILMRRKSELERDLGRARGTNFVNAKTDSVSPGTKVTVTDLDTKQQEIFSVLGAWDSDPDQGVISYLTPVAQSLLNKKAGDEVEFEMDGNKKRYHIDSISAVKME
ncbi:MAG: GreA/GreB family elongation factor, partial [Limisphaerales bacterium]